MHDDSRCPKGLLCDFEAVGDYGDAQVEQCLLCGKKVVYHKDSIGGVDNAKYLRDHLRHTLQPFGEHHGLFLQIYGYGPIQALTERWKDKRPKHEIKAEWEQMRQDIRRSMRKRYV